MNRGMLTAAVLLTALICEGCSQAGAERADRSTDTAVPRIRTALVETGPAAPPIVASGRLAPSSETALSFRSGGTLQTVRVRPGETVRAGQILATLHSTELNAAVDKAREVLEQSRRNRTRAEGLFEREIIARQELDDARTSETLAAKELDSITYRAHLTLRAPANGVVQQRLAEPGQNVTAGQAVLSLSQDTVDRGEYVFLAGLPEQERLRVSVDDPVSVAFESFPGRRFRGRVLDVTSASDDLDGNYEVSVALVERAPRLLSGMIGRAEISPTADIHATRSYIPLTALVEGTQKQARVFVLEHDKARALDVSIAFLHGTRAALSTELPAGTQVITDGAGFLFDGQRVVAIY